MGEMSKKYGWKLKKYLISNIITKTIFIVLIYLVEVMEILTFNPNISISCK